MNLLWLLRDLRRQRILLIAVAVLALLAALAATYRVSSGKVESRRHHVGVATARMLIDTPSSQVIEVSPKGSDTLGMRANLIASLMVDGDFKQAIAERAGLPADELVGISQTGDADSQSETPQPKDGDNVLTTRVVPDLDGNQLPIIQIETQARDGASAAKLADAAIASLREYVDTQGNAEGVPSARRLRVSGLGPAQASEVNRGPSLWLAFGVAIFVLVAGCGLVLVVAHSRRAMQLAAEWQLDTADEAPDEVFDHDAVPTVVRSGRARTARTDGNRSFADDEEQARSA